MTQDIAGNGRMVMVTDTADFIGFHPSRLLLESGFQVQGLDSMTDFRDVVPKRPRHDVLPAYPGFQAGETRLEDQDKLWSIARAFASDVIVHRAVLINYPNIEEKAALLARAEWSS